MNNYIKRLINRAEQMAHPASGWLRGGAGTLQKKKSKKSNNSIVIQPTPDSHNVRGKAAKKNDNSRYTPAP